MVGRRTSFDEPLPDRPRTSFDGAALAYKHIDPEGNTYTYRFRALTIASVGADLARIIGSSMAGEFEGQAVSSVKGHYNSWLRFCNTILERDIHRHRELDGLKSITAQDIDLFDVPGRYGGMLHVVKTLRLVNHLSPGLLQECVQKRILRVSNTKAKVSKPREPFSPFVTKQILEKSDIMVAATRDRIRAGRIFIEELRSKISKTEPEVAFLKNIDGERLSDRDRERAHDQWARQYGRPWPSGVEGGAAGLGCLVASADAFAFLYALGLRVEMPIECLKSLGRDCLKNPTGGFVDIEYKKARGASAEKPRTLTEHVRDGGISTPGGIIRLLLDMTKPAADHLQEIGSKDAGKLWVGVRQCWGDLYTAISFSYANDFIRSLGIAGDDGKQLLSAPPARMRKTFKSNRYKEIGGHLRRFASDNSPSIADRHYADLEAHKDLHEKAVEDGAKQLLDAMRRGPSVIAASDEARAKAEGLTVGDKLVSPETCREILDGMWDLWLSSCADFWSSPFGTNADGTCRSPFDDCIHCRNAVFTAGKLPGLLSYLDWIEERRTILTEDAWSATLSASYVRITTQILPRFETHVIEAARGLVAAAAPDTDFFLPLQRKVS